MSRDSEQQPGSQRPTRRTFLHRIGQGAAAGALTGAMGSGIGVHGEEAARDRADVLPVVKRRPLGTTGLEVPEIGFGGHSWAYARIADGLGGLRKPTLDEAVRMISMGLEMGVNLFDACTPPEEHTVPGQVIRQLQARDRVLISARLCHKMKGREADRPIIRQWVDERLKLWQTDYFDILMLTNESNVTPESGYWDMSFCVEELDVLKKQGKIRFAGFGCHFEPQHYLDAFKRFGRAFDICSMPYNIRHRAAEAIMPEAKRVGLGMITIKPFARGALLEGQTPAGTDGGLARDMIAFVLENPSVDCCLCGVHTEAHVRENFSASGAALTPARRQRLEQVAARTSCRQHAWLEQGWVC